MTSVLMVDWGCEIAVVDGVLCCRVLDRNGVPFEGDEFMPVEYICPHALAAYNAALGTSFTADQFGDAGCNDCE